MNSNIIVLMAIMAIIALLYSMLNIRKARREAVNMQKLKELALSRGCQIVQFERWNKSILGIDPKRQLLFIINRLNEEETQQMIDLSSIANCWVNESSRSVKYKDSHQKVVDKIELVLSHTDKRREDQLVEFYNSAKDNLFLAGELQLAEKWKMVVLETIRQ